VELARFAWGYEKHEAQMAAADVLREYGHEIPPRPASWFAKQARQKPIRHAIDKAKIRHLQRRVFRIFLPMVEEIEDTDERREETKYLWDAAGEIAALMLAGRTPAAKQTDRGFRDTVRLRPPETESENARKVVLGRG
jgi:hypothetical protein